MVFYQDSEFLTLDATTLRNLEILEPLTRDAPNAACLYSAVNHTVTPMGARLSAESVKACLTEKTKAILPVDLYGGVPDYAALRAHQSIGRTGPCRREVRKQTSPDETARPAAWR